MACVCFGHCTVSECTGLDQQIAYPNAMILMSRSQLTEEEGRAIPGVGIALSNGTSTCHRGLAVRSHTPLPVSHPAYLRRVPCREGLRGPYGRAFTHTPPCRIHHPVDVQRFFQGSQGEGCAYSGVSWAGPPSPPAAASHHDSWTWTDTWHSPPCQAPDTPAVGITQGGVS